MKEREGNNYVDELKERLEIEAMRSRAIKRAAVIAAEREAAIVEAIAAEVAEVERMVGGWV